MPLCMSSLRVVVAAAITSSRVVLPLNSAQLFSLRVRACRPSAISSMLSWQDSSINVGSSLLNVDCFLKQDNRTSPFFIKSAVLLCLPALVFLMPILFFMPYSQRLRARGVVTWMQDTKELYT